MKELVQGVFKKTVGSGKRKKKPISQKFIFLLHSFVATDIIPSWPFLYILFFVSPLLWHTGAIVTACTDYYYSQVHYIKQPSLLNCGLTVTGMHQLPVSIGFSHGHLTMTQ